MAVDFKHPDYDDRADEWRVMRDCARGAKAVTERGQIYLPMPSGFRAQLDAGVAMYGAYGTRAQFPDILAPTLRGMVGVIHRVEAQIEGLEDGKPLAYLWERATADGLPLEAMHRRLTAEVLLMGRYGLLTDVSAEGGVPYLAGYSAESLINWAEDRTFYVLDESGLERNGFEWVDVKRYRVLALTDSAYSAEIYEGEGVDEPQGQFEPRRRQAQRDSLRGHRATRPCRKARRAAPDRGRKGEPCALSIGRGLPAPTVLDGPGNVCRHQR
jgi:hypothetical protein